MDLKSKILNNKSFDRAHKLFNMLPLGGKIGVGIGAFFIGSALIRSAYSKFFNATHFDSTHSGKKSSMSSYSTQAMTDFGSGWKGLSSNILKLTDVKSSGLGSFMRENMTAFTSSGVDLGKTMIKMTKKQGKHKITNIHNKIDNTVLELYKIRNIGHIVL